jgi:hypothetical protein
MMKRLRDPNWVLIFLFLGIIGIVPLAQTIIEARGDQGVAALEVFNDWPTAERLRAYEKNLESASWAGRLSRPWIQFIEFKWLKYGGEKAVVGALGWYFFKPGLNYMLARADARMNATNDPVAAIVDFRDQLAARGIQLMVMPIPNKDSIYPGRLSSRIESGRTVVAPRTRELMAKLRAANVEVVDVFEAFRQAREKNGDESRSALYLAQDTHWSPAGVDLVAKLVARRLTALGWVQPGGVDYLEKPAPTPRLGDIVRMLQTPQIDRAVAPENVAAFQVARAENAQLYKDDPNAEVVVIGDSFMRIYQEDQPMAAGFIAHLAKELKQPVLSLVNDGGGSTLVREELCARPPFFMKRKVLLWEFVERDIGIGLKGWQRTRLPAAPAVSAKVRQ